MNKDELRLIKLQNIKKALSQNEIASLWGCSQSTVSRRIKLYVCTGLFELVKINGSIHYQKTELLEKYIVAILDYYSYKGLIK